MDIFDFAMQMEKDGEAYYRELADNCSDSGLEHILIMLAEDEVKHHQVLGEMKASAHPKMADSAILENARNLFVEMKEDPPQFSFAENQADFYRKAQEIERKSEEFYREKAAQVQDHFQQEMLLRIAGEENRHYFLLDHIITFVSRPKQWVENAEFHHLEEY